MDIKKVFQYSLLILLILVSFLFYYKYFTSDSKIVKNKKSEKVLEQESLIINQSDLNKNIIENLKYVSEDLIGNTYTITAQSATLKEDKLNQVQLFEVNAEIVRKNQEIIYIYSKQLIIIK